LVLFARFSMFLYQLSLQISGINPRVETETGGAKRLAVRYLKFAEKMRRGDASFASQTETYGSQAIPSNTSNCCPIFETGKPMSVDDHHIYSFLHKLHEVFSLLRTRLTWQLVLRKISGIWACWTCARISTEHCSKSDARQRPF